jgi:hypothetical protein
MLGVPVYVYLLGPSDTADRLFTTNPLESFTAEELNLWLGNLEATTGIERLTVVVEAPYSGSLIDASTTNPGTLSATNRVIITATSPTLPAYLTPAGALFSDALTNALSQELNLRAAFDAATQAVNESVGSAQQPWMDDNGDSLPDHLPGAAQATDGRTGAHLTASTATGTAGEYLLAGIRSQNRGLDTNRSAAPEILEAGLDRGQATILQARARDDTGISAFTAMARPCALSPSAGSQPVLHPQSVTLAPANGKPGWFQVNVTPAKGICGYILVVVDKEGNQSKPYYFQFLYPINLPLLRR